MGVVCLCAASIPAFAFAQGTTGDRQDAPYEFTTTKAGAPSGQNLTIDYKNPDDPDGKPPAVRRVVTSLAPGARIDTKALTQCEASDAELMAVGAAACPAKSKLTDGEIIADSGVPGPMRFIASDVTFFNNDHELIYLVALRDGGARLVVRGTIRRRSVVTESPFLPGTPPDGTAIDTVEANDPKIVNIVDGERRSYVTTPPRCPADGSWTNRVKFTYDDGETQTEPTQVECEDRR